MCSGGIERDQWREMVNLRKALSALDKKLSFESLSKNERIFFP